MSKEISTARLDRADLDEQLAAWLGWFAADPVPTEFAILVEQLEAAYDRAAPLSDQPA